MSPKKKVFPKKGAKRKTIPSLKSTSGAGFLFEDKATAMLLCEMLSGVSSFGPDFGVTQKLRKQAIDWEPFGDLVLNAQTSAGEDILCVGSIKSNRVINSNGCDKDICAGIWDIIEKPDFMSESGFLLLISAPMPNRVADHLSNLCRQARGTDAECLETQIIHKDIRKIYESFRKAGDSTTQGFPRNVLAKLIHREFDFEESVSQTETRAIERCREVLKAEEQTSEKATALWKRLCELAQNIRVSGGTITRTEISENIRNDFGLRDDPCDVAKWAKIRTFSRETMDEIETSLTGGICLPRKDEDVALRAAIAKSHACYVIGDSGSGKSAMIKRYTTAIQTTGAEIVWIKAERFNVLASALPDLLEVMSRCRRAEALLVIDALEGCVAPESFISIARLISTVSSVDNSPWSVIISCQTPDWTRVCTAFIKHLPRHAALTKRVECGPLGKEDFDFVCVSSPTVARLGQDPKLRGVLSSPKMLDVLLSGQLTENRLIAGEADLVEWWWEQQVRGSNMVAVEERVARELASRMADEFRSELPPDSVAGEEIAVDKLIRTRVLKRTSDGLLRFEHDLLADWSREMYLRGLGQEKISFIKGHIENPPWLRAVRLLSQHLLDRVGDLEQWRDFLNSVMSNVRSLDELPAENLQIVDIWLEGIIFSLNFEQMLATLSSDLFSSDGWLLRRLIRRLMLVGTFPDLVVQKRLEHTNAELREKVAGRYRLPMGKIWKPFVHFLTSHSELFTDMVPVEIGEIAEMWDRMETYWQIAWTDLAAVVTLNAEKEIRREIAGKYLHNFDSRSFERTKNARELIYLGALFAATQQPERVAKLLSKAAGIAPWEEDDISSGIREDWLGEWKTPQSIFGEALHVDTPPKSWPRGPVHKTSRDFFHAWFEQGASIRVFRHSPETACNVTLGFLLDWPKRTLLPETHHGTDMDRYGFSFDADRMYPAFYMKGPFLPFLQENWEPALELIVHLTNFATERYADWWPYSDLPMKNFTFSTQWGDISWHGNSQVYAWSRYHMNTADVITCALMALEKWLDNQLEKKESIATPVQFLYQHGNSLAFAGLLIALGKRHPELFLNELKPLLFLRKFYLFDMQTVREFTNNGGYWPQDGELINTLRQKWETLPGRREDLLTLANKWFVTHTRFQPAFIEVASMWCAKANALSADSMDRLPLLRWAAMFNLANWKEIKLPDGNKCLQYEQPKELRDDEAIQHQAYTQELQMIPFQCSEMLEKRPELSSEHLTRIWSRLHNWSLLEEASKQQKEEEDAFTSSFRDHRHARAGLIAVLFCLGNDWVDADNVRRPWLETELQKLLDAPPNGFNFSPDEIHSDGEIFIAYSVVQCWAHSPNNKKWRAVVGEFVSAYRYWTIQKLFEEAFRERSKLGNEFCDLEGLLLSFSAVRQKANIRGVKPHPEIIDKWQKKCIPQFASGRGPMWRDDWKTIENGEESSSSINPRINPNPQAKRSRRNYGLDMDVLLAAFGKLPPLSKAENDNERKHWLCICREMLATYIRTLPLERGGDESETWKYEPWEIDRKICTIVAARLLQCTPQEQQSLWMPIISLPPAAHDHITSFLNNLLREAIRTEPIQVVKLIPIWRAMIEYLFASPKWASKLNIHENDVWTHLFLYGSIVLSVRDKDHIPLVAALHGLFERHVKTIGQNSYNQSAFAKYALSDAGEQLLVDAFEWLSLDWQKANAFFWERIVELGNLSELLQRAWQKHFSEIQKRPDALRAFKTLTLNLASRQVPVAVEIQKQLGR